MALTRITKGVIKPNENYDTHNINSTGIVTAVGANFSGNVSVGGVLTYEDVTNIDSVGIITARQGIFIDDSITHIGDTDTKIRFNSNDNISFETSGSQQLTIGLNTKIRFPAADTFSVETAGAERLRITSDGDVLIGATSAVANTKLTVEDSGTTLIRVSNTDDGTAGLVLRNTGTSDWAILNQSANLRFQVAGNEKLRITNTGLVGIGTSNPSQTLDIWSTNPVIRLTDTNPFEAGAYGQISQTGNVLQILADSGNTSGHGSVFFYSYNDNDSFNTYRISDNVHQWYISGVEKARLHSNGYLGIGTNIPQALLHLQGTGGNTQGIYFKNGPHDVVRQYFSNGNDNSDFVITYDGTGGAEITLEQTGNVILNESNGGKVVIGNTAVTPTNPLTIAGASASAILEIQRTSANSTGAVGAVNFTAIDGHSVANIYALGDGDSDGAHLIFKTTSNAAENSPYGTATRERLRIKSNGYVGINTTNPLSPLDLRGDLNINNNTIISNFDSNGVGGGNIDHFYHDDAPNYGTGGTWNFVSDGTYKATGNSTLQAGFVNSSGGGNFLGNVGIGLTSPEGRLHISSGTSGDCELIIEADTDNNNENDNPRILFRQDGGEDQSAIGTISNELVLYNSVSGGGIVFNTGTSVGYTNATEKFRIQSDGDLIHTSTDKTLSLVWWCWK